MDNYYNRTSFWAFNGTEIVKYIGWDSYNYTDVYSLTKSGKYSSLADDMFLPVRYAPTLFQVFTKEPLQIIGHGELDSPSNSQLTMSLFYVYATKFTPTKNGVIKGLSVKLNTTNNECGVVNYLVGIYSSTYQRLISTTTYFNIRSGTASYWVGWATRDTVMPSLAVTAGTTYYLAVKFDHSNCKLFYTSGTTNQSFSYNDGTQAMPATLSRTANYSYEFFIVGYEINMTIRGIDVNPPTDLYVGWNYISPWTDDVGHRLIDICATINGEGIEATVTIKNNGTEYRYNYGYDGNATITILSESDNLTLYCATSGSWYHTYTTFNYSFIREQSASFTTLQTRHLNLTRSIQEASIASGLTETLFLWAHEISTTLTSIASSITNFLWTQTLTIAFTATTSISRIYLWARSVSATLTSYSNIALWYGITKSVSATLQAYATGTNIISYLYSASTSAVLTSITSVSTWIGRVASATARLTTSITTSRLTWLFRAETATLTTIATAVAYALTTFTSPVWVIGPMWVIGSNWIYGISVNIAEAFATITSYTGITLWKLLSGNGIALLTVLVTVGRYVAVLIQSGASLVAFAVASMVTGVYSVYYGVASAALQFFSQAGILGGRPTINEYETIFLAFSLILPWVFLPFLVKSRQMKERGE
jgi:hypothetical protein